MNAPAIAKAATACIEFAGALIVAAYASRAAFLACFRGELERARRLVAQGAITGLEFKAAATFLNAMQLFTWEHIGMFAALLALRMLLKKIFRLELARSAHGGHSGADASSKPVDGRP